MTPKELTEDQKIALALRLRKRVVIRQEHPPVAIGLGAHGMPGCCRPGQPVLIDFHNPTRPEDVIGFCPATVPGIETLLCDVERAGEIRKHGLKAWYGVEGIAKLPRATLSFSDRVEGARARFEAERLDAQRGG